MIVIMHVRGMLLNVAVIKYIFCKPQHIAAAVSKPLMLAHTTDLHSYTMAQQDT